MDSVFLNWERRTDSSDGLGFRILPLSGSGLLFVYASFNDFCLLYSVQIEHTLFVLFFSLFFYSIFYFFYSVGLCLYQRNERLFRSSNRCGYFKEVDKSNWENLRNERIKGVDNDRDTPQSQHHPHTQRRILTFCLYTNVRNCVRYTIPPISLTVLPRPRTDIL